MKAAPETVSAIPSTAFDGDHPPVTHRELLAWACLLVALYLVVGLVGWKRTLIPDEIRPLLLAAKPLEEHLEFLRMDLVQTPLSFLFHRLWLGMFGHTDNAVKALALLLNIPTIALFTWLASKYTSHWRLAAFLFSIPFLRIGSAVNLVRMYGMLLLLTVIALVIWERWRKKPSNGKLMAWAAVMILVVYTHGSGLLLLPAFFAMNWLYGPRRRAFTIVCTVALLALLPWIAYVFPVYQARGIGDNVGAIRANPMISLGQLPFFFLSGEDPGGGTPAPLLHRLDLRIALVLAAGVAHIALLTLACRGIYRSFNQWSDEKWRGLWLATLLCGIPVIALFGFSVLFTPVLHPRYVLIGLTGYWLLITLLGQLGGRAGKALVIGIFIPWALVSVGLLLAQNWGDSPVRRATTYLARETRSSDLIICDKHMSLGWQVYWEWTRRLGKDPAQVETLPSGVVPYLNSIAPAKPLENLNLEKVNRIWFLYSRKSSVNPVSEFLIARGYSLDRSARVEIPSLLIFSRLVDARAGGGL